MQWSLLFGKQNLLASEKFDEIKGEFRFSSEIQSKTFHKNHSIPKIFESVEEDDEQIPLFGLSIDGGSFSGLMPAQYLDSPKVALSQSWIRKSPLYQVFHYVDVTSIEEILALRVATNINPK